MTSTAYRSPWALTILSLLYERDMHPYEMRRLVRHRGKGDMVDLRPGSAYRTIERLQKAGLIEPVETTRQGRFPERTVYRITAHGREELEEWMRELISTPVKTDFPQFLQAISVLPVLERQDALIQLEARMVRLEGEIAGMEAMVRRLDTVLPRIFQLETECALALWRAELAWVTGLVEDLRSGRLAWDLEELRERYGDTGECRPLELTLVQAERLRQEGSGMD